MPEKEQVVSLDVVKQLLAEQARQNAENLAEVIRAVKAPNVIEQQKLDQMQKEAAQKLADRKSQAASVLETINARKLTQQYCVHMQPNGAGQCAYVMEKN